MSTVPNRSFSPAAVGTAERPTTRVLPRLVNREDDGPPPPVALELRTVLLVGTAASVAGLRVQLGMMGAEGDETAGGGNEQREFPSLVSPPPQAHKDSWTVHPSERVDVAALVELVKRQKPTTAIVSLPGGMGGQAGEICAALEDLGVRVRTMPTLDDLLAEDDDDAAAARTATPTNKKPNTFAGPSRTIDLATLIGRTPHEIDREGVAKVIAGKRVLITGAGGSIGSELARVCAEFGPSQLVLMERSENALFEIDRQMGRLFPGVSRKAVLHDVVDAEGTMRLLSELKPHAVLHAAAHKHVPLMEDHPAHALTNNLFGTKAIADAALACGCERFSMISSDKAVNPTSVMGATKRLAEMYVRGLAERRGGQNGKTHLSMVRFGNVLGSTCSVLAIWTVQLGEGGPITVTDPRMTRYFMTIPEAATLVVQSMALRGGEGDRADAAPVYVLDMGEPVGILDLAVRFVRSHGLTPRVKAETASDPKFVIDHLAAIGESAELARGNGPTMDVVFTGIRPGEKMHEELAYATELLSPTTHPGVNAWKGPGASANTAPAPSAGAVGTELDRMMTDLSVARHSTSRETVLEAIRRHVPELRPAARNE